MPAELTLRQLEYLVAVADHGTLSGAAATVHVSTTAIASALNDMEQLVGTPLTIRRRSKGVVLTPAGRVAVQRARDVIAGARGLVEAVDYEVGSVGGTLRIGCFPTLATWAVPMLVEWFAVRFPRVRVEVVESDSPQLLDGIAAGHFDLLILFASHFDAAAPGPRPGTVHEIHEARPRVLLPAEHRLAGRGSVWLRELADEPMVLLDLAPVRDILRGVLRQAGVEHCVRWLSPTVGVVRNMVGRGLAWSILVGLGSSDLSPEGRRLARVPIADELPANGVVAVTADRSVAGPKVAAALEALREHAHNTP